MVLKNLFSFRVKEKLMAIFNVSVMLFLIFAVVSLIVDFVKFIGSLIN